MFLKQIVTKQYFINKTFSKKKMMLQLFNSKIVQTKSKQNFFFFSSIIEIVFKKQYTLATFLKKFWSELFIIGIDKIEKHSIKYILKINFNNSNIKLNLTNSNGYNIFKSSSGILGYQSSNKRTKIALISIIKKLKFKLKKIRSFGFSIHMFGVKLNKKFLLQKLNKFLNLKIFKTYNLVPFNGCRPLKKKRKKFKKKLTLI